MSVLSAPHFHNEEAAYAYVEARLWPEGPVCPHCGGVERVGKMGGASTRIGTYKCYQCRKPFTVKVGTVFEASHVPLRHWLQAMFLMASSKKGVSANQLHRTLGCTLKTGWFIAHRLREAMRSDGLAPFGSDGGMVEVDETYIGVREGMTKAKKGGAHKMQVLSLVERNTKQSRSFVIDRADIKTIASILDANLAREAHLMTDEWQPYKSLAWNFAAHSTVHHRSEEYVRYEGGKMITTNTVEGFFSVFKRGMKGVYQHCREKHLHRYMAEFDFRYSNRIALGVNDVQRADKMLAGVVGKRLTYRTVGAARA
jgi:transposase-like protein